MFRHRRRLIAKRLSKLMRKKNQKYMKNLFAKFLDSRAQQIQQLATEQEQQQEVEVSQEEISEEEIIQQEDQGPSQFNLSDYISTLSPQQKRAFRMQNPELPETFFMSKKEKEKYFNKKNSKFQKDLNLTPERKSKNKKSVHFTDNFSYKLFNNKHKVAEVKTLKELKTKYNNQIHFS